MNNFELPENLPVPVDDGAADHLPGSALPRLSLASTSGEAADLGAFRGYLIVYVYPMTGRPGVPLPPGWDEIPGARGCTPQSCSFRDHYAEVQQWEATLFGLSVQTTEYQREAKERLHLPFELLSDTALALKEALSLPTFEVEGKELYRRLTLIARDGKIAKVFYPIFPPNRNAGDVIDWFREHA